jgi:hypothetical protein
MSLQVQLTESEKFLAHIYKNKPEFLRFRSPVQPGVAKKTAKATFHTKDARKLLVTLMSCKSKTDKMKTNALKEIQNFIGTQRCFICTQSDILGQNGFMRDTMGVCFHICCLDTLPTGVTRSLLHNKYLHEDPHVPRSFLPETLSNVILPTLNLEDLVGDLLGPAPAPEAPLAPKPSLHVQVQPKTIPQTNIPEPLPAPIPISYGQSVPILGVRDLQGATEPELDFLSSLSDVL